MQAGKHIGRLPGAALTAWNKRWEFLVAFLMVFFFSFSVLLYFDIVPDTPAEAAIDETPSVTLDASPLVGSAPRDTRALSPNAIDAFSIGQFPERIVIPAIGLAASIANPASTNVETLDRYLLKGAVRYPTSGLLGVNGNVVLFAHSSYLPIVNNLAYKTFDDIQKLKEGDEITVSSSDRAYVYAVDTVKQASADSAAIPLTVTDKMLTLSTCDSFGEKSDRFIVTAHFVESKAL